MIDGEAGAAIMERISDLRMETLVDGDQVTASLVAACITDALRKGESPRDIALALWDAVPSEEEWENGTRETVLAAIDEFDERRAA